MKNLILVFWVMALGAATSFAQSRVTLSVGLADPGPAIPDDFVGLSFGMRALLPNRTGEHFFSPTNKPLVQLFQNVGLRHLRVGGTTVESPIVIPIPDEAAIDDLFAFNRVAGVHKTIYSLRLLEPSETNHYAEKDAEIARYIWSHYQPLLQCFSIGNEPDLQRVFKEDHVIRDFDTYLARWRMFAAAVTKAAPEAKFAGPDGGSGQVKWTTQFAENEKDSGLMDSVTEHFYAGGKGRGVEASKAIEDMLSRDWLTHYQSLYDKMAVRVMATGLPYRFTEANDHYSGGVADASDTFTGALWALDFLHWWAAHHARGMDFHNTQWVVSDIIAPDENGHLRVNPKAYGLKAFDIGGHGRVTQLKMENTEKINLTAYALRRDAELFVTIINKDYGASGRATEVRIVCERTPERCEAMFLAVAGGDVAAKSGVTLGGASINGDVPWAGQWTTLAQEKPGFCSVKVPAASAAIVKIAVADNPAKLPP